MSVLDHHIWLSEDTEPDGPYQSTAFVEKALDEYSISTARLVLSIEPDRLRYVLVSSAGDCLQAKSFESTGQLSRDNFLRFIFEKEKILRESFIEVQVYQFQSDFFLLPSAFHHPGYETAFGRLLLNHNLFADELHSQPIPFLKASLLTSLLPELRSMLDHYLASYQFSHPASIVLSIGHRESREGVEAYVLFEREQMLITLFEDGKLLFANSFLCHSATDVCYFFQLARKGAGLEQKRLMAYFMGSGSFVMSSVVDWQAYGIHWEEAPLPKQLNGWEDNQPLQSWRYLLV